MYLSLLIFLCPSVNALANKLLPQSVQLQKLQSLRHVELRRLRRARRCGSQESQIFRPLQYAATAIAGGPSAWHRVVKVRNSPGTRPKPGRGNLRPHLFQTFPSSSDNRNLHEIGRFMTR
ncbi:hypothetical protein BC629DRAFT_182873 [Irpex lacteus]|nr:hypothetical protein BC629DRAFT_182873 [Irpex lacteus]